MFSNREHILRYLLIAGVFCLACVFYIGKLFTIQKEYRDTAPDDTLSTREVVVQAVRGEIYDRNGTPLVTNRYSYDMVLSHSSFSALPTQRANRLCLRLLELCAPSGKHTEASFPMTGTYPYYAMTNEAMDGSSQTYFYLQRVLKAVGIKENATLTDIRDYYVETYSLLSTDSDGNRHFADDEVDALIRLRYDMDVRRFQKNNDYVFAKDVDLALMAAVKESISEGVTFSVTASRIYHYPDYARHILGTAGPIYAEEWDTYNSMGYQMNSIVGKSGCEYAFEDYLRGIDGKLKITEDQNGNVLETEMISEPVAGKDVYLTIDINLQIAAEDGLAENVAYVVERAQGYPSLGADCNAGAVVAMNPNTGEILAMASYPTYEESPFNRALMGCYAPGSTLKMGVALAGMADEKITPSSLIDCNGKYTRYSDYQPSCSTFGTNHRGKINVSKAIAVSCNCFFYELGYRMGIDTLDAYLQRLGIGQATGVELGERTGTLAGPAYREETHGDPWMPGNTLQAAIGQSDHTVTPLQLASYLSTIVNGGIRKEAHLLDRIYLYGNQTPSLIYDNESNVLDRISFSDGARDAILNGMREMVTSHTTANRFLSKIPVPVGGKTGTAETGSGCENALFVCAAPYNNPEIVISAVLEQGHSGEYASLAAARILERYYAD